jgi:hypothetical protein
VGEGRDEWEEWEEGELDEVKWEEVGEGDTGGWYASMRCERLLQLLD